MERQSACSLEGGVSFLTCCLFHEIVQRSRLAHLEGKYHHHCFVGGACSLWLSECLATSVCGAVILFIHSLCVSLPYSPSSMGQDSSGGPEGKLHFLFLCSSHALSGVFVGSQDKIFGDRNIPVTGVGARTLT